MYLLLIQRAVFEIEVLFGCQRKLWMAVYIDKSIQHIGEINIDIAVNFCGIKFLLFIRSAAPAVTQNMAHIGIG